MAKGSVEKKLAVMMAGASYLRRDHCGTLERASVSCSVILSGAKNLAARLVLDPSLRSG
jgi:hypothetical protein